MAPPLVYACSGCSSAAQLANHVAVRLDREGLAEMSCIAGLGGDVPALLRTARKAVVARRPVLAIDGCALACTRQTLARHGITPTHHVQLWRMGVHKRLHEDFSAGEADEVWGHCRAIVAEAATPGLKSASDSPFAPAYSRAADDAVAAPSTHELRTPPP